MIHAEDREPIFVIGYPKSGNTWITRLVGEALNSPTGSGYLLHQYEIASEGEKRPGKYFVMKSHHSERDRIGVVEGRIIYVVRDFRDVLVSGFFHFHRKVKESNFKLNSCKDIRYCLRRLYFGIQVRRMAVRWQGPIAGAIYNSALRSVRNLLVLMRIKNKHRHPIIGNWSDHVKYWTSQPGIHTIKYEDLLQKPFGTLAECFSDLDLEYDVNTLKKAIENQSFSKRKTIFKEAGDERNASFLRKGKSGDWENFLSEKQQRYILKLHGRVLSLLKYI